MHGWPDTEGNAVEILRGLQRRYPGRIYWLTNQDPPQSRLAAGLVDAGRITALRKNSARAFLISLRAEVVFFTHGLMTAVPPPNSRLVVNVWHGDGPKAITDKPRSSSTVAVASTELWAGEKARLFGLPITSIAVVGNPRVEAMRGGADQRRGLDRLGVPRDQTLVLWLPTFRRGSDGKAKDWFDGQPLSTQLSGGVPMPPGVSFVVKPHPMDLDDYRALGATVVSNADLQRAGMTLYELMGAADALVSDASSAWVDYLLLDRPIGFFFPDQAEFGSTRGYNVPDLLAVLPGQVLTSVNDLTRFLGEVATGDASPPSRYAAYARIGVRENFDVVDALFDWLDQFQVGRGRQPLLRHDRPLHQPDLRGEIRA